MTVKRAIERIKLEKYRIKGEKRDLVKEELELLDAYDVAMVALKSLDQFVNDVSFLLY